MTPAHEEALRLLRLADRDIAVFMSIKDAPEIHLSMVCFHAQQAVEKALKAVLFRYGIQFERTHDLVKLARHLRSVGLTLSVTDEGLRKLNPYAVTLRYDDEEIELLSRDEALIIIEKVRTWAGQQVGEPLDTGR
jgi:Uncharacterized conserved protein related to C-terminal domain of eukaryotic chaperone, SACSIN